MGGGFDVRFDQANQSLRGAVSLLRQRATERGQGFHRRPAGNLALGQRREVPLGGLREKIYDVVEFRRLAERVAHRLSLAEAWSGMWCRTWKKPPDDGDGLPVRLDLSSDPPWEAGPIDHTARSF